LSILLVSLLVMDFVVLGSWFGVEKVAERLRETRVTPAEETGARAADAERLDVAVATLTMFRDAPVLGVGPGGFRAAFPAYKPALVRLFYDHAHNDWVQLLAERGLIGAALWAAAVGATMWGALAALRRRRDPIMRGIAFGSAVGMLALSLHGLADFNLQIPANAAYFQALMGLALGAAAIRGPAADSRSTAGRSRSRRAAHGDSGRVVQESV
jgi:O-antigen ligase